jgi:serine/threonine protein kinase
MRVKCEDCLTESSVSNFGSGTAACPRCGTPMHISDTDQGTLALTVSERKESTPTVVPDCLGKYAIVRQAASGGFGTVYEAYDEQLHSRVAIKVSRHQGDTAVNQAMLDEARLHAKLRHPNIVRVLAVERQADDGIYIVMDWINGQTLRDYMARCKLSVAQSLTIAQQIADAMHYAHRVGFVHRDLKPNNILIDEAGKPYVADFGLAVTDDSQRDRRYEFAGTVAYMSPEQVRSQSQYLDGRTDIWAIGVMLYEMLAGQRPFRGSRHELLDEILNREPKPLRLLNEEISPALEAIVNACLAKEVRQRIPTARELSERLQQEQQHRDQLENRGRSVTTYRLAGVGLLLLLAGLVSTVLQLRGLGTSAIQASPSALSALPTADSMRPMTRDECVSLVPGRWHKLLDRPLERLSVPPAGSKTVFIENPELEELTLMVNGQAILRAGTISCPNCTIQFSLSQPTWSGDICFFYGMRPSAAAPKSLLTCEEILFVAIPELPRTNFRLDRWSHDFNVDYVVKYGCGLDSVVVPHPGKKRVDCMLTFRDGQLSMLTWDGHEQHDLFDNEINFPRKANGCEGDFGFHVRDATLTISSLRIFIEEAP